MLDQLFTVENFRRIFDRENRQGNDLTKRFFPELAPHNAALKDCRRRIRLLRAKKTFISDTIFGQQLETLFEELKTLKKDRSIAIDQTLERVYRNVSVPGFKIDLAKKIGPNGKDVYCLDGKAETFFVMKQLQLNLKKLYGVKQANRHELVCRVRDILSTKFPYKVLKTDISSFYENIEAKGLIRKLEEDQLLSVSSKRYIKSIIHSYELLSGSNKGVPRGVGISAYLAELYLRPFDRAMNEIPGTTLYCRYVDDIVLVFSPFADTFGNISYESQVSDVFRNLDVPQNLLKTHFFDLASYSASKKPIKFEYLGYRFKFAEKLHLSPSSRKIRKYKHRMNLAFKTYALAKTINPRRSHRDLVSRIKFLTGNFRLVNSKASAAIGVYYSSSLADDISVLNTLDKLLRKKIDGLNNPKLKTRLKKLKFTTGFNERKFYNFNTNELKSITEAWKHA